MLKHQPHELRHLEHLCPAAVPYAMVEAHEGQAKANHDQTVARLAERGGLSVAEMLAVLEDRPWSSREHPKRTDVACLPELLRLVAAHLEAE